MDGTLTETARLVVQWLFAPLLAVVVLAWLCVKLEAAGVFAAIRDSIRKMPVGRRFAFVALAAGFVAFAGTKTNLPPMNLPGPFLPPPVLLSPLPVFNSPFVIGGE